MLRDVDAYAAQYAQHAKIKRLICLAKHHNDKNTSLRAAHLAHAALLSTSNTHLYEQLIDAANINRDETWLEQTAKNAATQLEALEQSLNTHKTSLVKENIRLAHNDLGHFYRERGDYANAVKCYARTRDYCTTSKHSVDMCLNAIQASVDMDNYTQVLSYLGKAEMLPDAVDDPLVVAQLRAASGLAHLDARKYRLAALKFVDIPLDVGNEPIAAMLSQEDVAAYGALCALASMTRAELQQHVIGNASFCALLELHPQIRELITNFHASRYSVCLSIMSNLKPLLEVDLYMRAHVDEIFQQIRFKALVLYFSPYQSVDVRRMALAFDMDLASLEKDVATLIMNGVINARIDSESKMLYAHHADERQATFDAAFALAENFRVNTKALLLRLNLLRSDFTLKGPGGDRRGNKSSRQEGRDMNELRMPERFYSAGPSDVAP